jgi:hypothetical protein
MMPPTVTVGGRAASVGPVGRAGTGMGPAALTQRPYRPTTQQKFHLCIAPGAAARPAHRRADGRGGRPRSL